MNATLAGFRHDNHLPPSEDELRRLVQYLADLRARAAAARSRTSPIHHFRVTAERDERTTYAPALDGRSWLLNVSPGTVDDRAVSILYQRQNDVRDWMPPATDHAPAGYPFADRTLFDQDEPRPQLIILAPKFGEPLTADDLFAPVADTARLSFFATEERWAYDLYQASVVLSTDTRTAFPPGTILTAGTTSATPSRRVRAHVHAVPRLDLLTTGMIEVARLYLLRDPDTKGGAHDDQIFVRQQLYWSLHSAQVAMTEITENFLDLVTGGNPFDPAQEVVTGTEVLFWSV